MSLTERIRAGRPSAAAPSLPSSVLVVADDAPVGRTVAIRESVEYHEASRVAPWDEPVSPFVRQARAGELRPAVLTTPVEGGDA